MGINYGVYPFCVLLVRSGVNTDISTIEEHKAQTIKKNAFSLVKTRQNMHVEVTCSYIVYLDDRRSQDTID